jgi:DNA-binding GntR family transcriptional regulator
MVTQVASEDNTVARLVDELRRMVMTGRLGVGQVLRQDELAAQFGVSRTPLREAIARLEAEGLFVKEPRRGTIVYRPSVHELIEIYEIRLCLEPFAAQLAAKNATPTDCEQLDAHVQHMREATAWQFPRLNREFHAYLSGLSHRPRLVGMIRSLTDLSDPFVRVLIGLGGRERAMADHAEIVEAVRAGNGRRASALVRSHLRATVTTVSSAVVDDPSREELPAGARAGRWAH